jgi:predicted porin
MFADDGHQSRTFHVDGQPSSTRFGIQGAAQMVPGLRAGARIETEMKSNPANAVNFTTPSVTNTFAERWLDLFFEGSWGRVNLGQGSGAADDASTIDLSGTALANGVCFCDWGGAINWRTAAGGTLATTVEGALNNQDFESRYDRVMYTTPVFGGFRGQAGFGQKGNDVVEASLWWSGKLAGEIQAAIGWSEEKTSTGPTVPNNETFGGSISWLHTSGFNVTAAYTEAEGFTSASVGDTFSGSSIFYYLKVGYKWGTHAIAVNYGIHEDHAVDGDEGTSIGIGYVWNPVRWAELYAGYHMFQLDRPGIDVEDVLVGTIGTRIRF